MVLKDIAAQGVVERRVEDGDTVAVGGVQNIRPVVAFAVVGAERQSVAHLAVLAVGAVVAAADVDVGAVGRVVVVFEGVLVEGRGVGLVVDAAVRGDAAAVVGASKQENAQIVPLAVELLGVVAAEHTEKVERRHVVHHIILVAACRRQIHLAAVPAVVARSGVVQVEVAPETHVAHTVDVVAQVEADASAQVASLAPRAVDLVHHVLQRVEVAWIEGVVLPRAAPAPRVVLAGAVAQVGENVDVKPFVGPGVAQPGTYVGLRGGVGAKADEVVLLDVGRSDDVDDRLGVGGILGRRVGDGLDAVQRVGRQGLQVGLQVLGGQLRRLVVDPNLHTADAAQRDVALHVDLHAGRVLQGVLGRSGLYRRVVGHVVYHLFAVHRIQRPRRGDFHRLKLCGTLFHIDCAQGRVVAHRDGDEPRGIAHIADAQQVVACRHLLDFEISARVGRGAFDEAAVLGGQHSHVAVHQRLVLGAVNQRAHHLEGRAGLDVLFLPHGVAFLLRLLHLAVAARTPSAGAARETAARRGTAGAARLGNDYG